MAYTPPNPNGQATMANSSPVVVASDQSAVPVSAASLPLPSGASTSANQSTGNTSLSTIATDVAPLVASGAGGYVRQDSTATIAKESGGNLATVATNTTGVATAANQTNATQQTKITDGTNIANVLKSDGTSAGQNAAMVARAYMQTTFTTTIVAAVGSTEVSNYCWVSVQITSQGGSSTVTFQGSNDNSNWFSIALMDAQQGTAAAAVSTTSARIFHGPTPFRYFRLNVTGIASGTTAGVIDFFTVPSALQSTGTLAQQTGTWTVQPGNTANTTPWLVDIHATAAALADTTTNPTTSLVGALAELFNGTSWDRVRSIVNATNSTGTGIAAAGILGQFDDASPTAITENQFGNLRMSANRNLYGTVRDAAGNERGANVDASNNLMVNIGAGTANISLGGTAVKDITQFGDGVTSGVISVGQQYYRPDTADYARWKGYMPWLPFTATADTQVKATAGFLHTVTIAATSATPVAGLLTIYDNTAESGTVLHSEWLTTSVTSHTITLDVKTSTGIYVGYDATLANVRVSGSYV